MVKTHPLNSIKDEIDQEIGKLPLIAKLMMSKAKPPPRGVKLKNP